MLKVVSPDTVAKSTVTEAVYVSTPASVHVAAVFSVLVISVFVAVAVSVASAFPLAANVAVAEEPSSAHVHVGSLYS